MRSLIFSVLFVSIATVAGVASAQDELPPDHPAVDGPAGDLPPGHGEEPPGEDGELPEGHVPVDQEGGEPGEGGGERLPPGHAAIPGMGDTHDAVEDDPELPRGTIVARVVDPAGEPVAQARVELGGAGRQTPTRRATTDANGEARWSGLPVGPDKAYEVVVPNGLGRFRSDPIRMTKRHGYRVTVTRHPVTRSTDTLLVFVLRTFVELAEEGNRLKVTQHLQLMNFGQEAIADAHGIPFPLPGGATGFRTDEEDMGSNRLVERDGKLFVEGTLPPGRVQLAYGFDLPISGRQFAIRQPIPYRLVVGEVYVEKAQRIRVAVEGMPKVREIDLEGRAFLATRISRRPDSPELDALVVRLSNLPGPGPGRWIALVLAIAAVGLGLFASLTGGDRPAAERAASRAERDALLEEADRLEKRKERGKVDGATYDRARERIVQRIAELLHLEDRG